MFLVAGELIDDLGVMLAGYLAKVKTRSKVSSASRYASTFSQIRAHSFKEKRRSLLAWACVYIHARRS
jgi:hypothetical protein